MESEFVSTESIPPQSSYCLGTEVNELIPTPHGIRTCSSRHPNFCRDLIREPFTPEEKEELRTWQARQPAKVSGNCQERRCAICHAPVPVLWRSDSNTCSSSCARKLRYQRQRFAGETFSEPEVKANKVN
jgi:predicted nucleic acid-binding Zn ribbon protein